MKKLLALLLSMMMVFTLGFAAAEEMEEIEIPEGMIAAEVLYEGEWIQFPDGNFEIYLPVEWIPMAMTDEMIAQNVFYFAATEDLSQAFAMGWKPLEAFCTIEELLAEIQTGYPEAQIMEVEGTSVVWYDDVENNNMCYIALDAVEPGMYMMAFTPIGDPVFTILSGLVATTMRFL